MNTLQDKIIDLCYLNYSVDQIANYLISEKNDSLDRQELIDLIEKTIKSHSEELEADAYLSSMECYYDNYCEY